MSGLADFSNEHDGLRLDHRVARPAEEGPHPAVLIFPTWAGRGAAEEALAQRLAGQGRIGIACDLYGEGRTGGDARENEALMTPLVSDRALLRARLGSVLSAARGLDGVDPGRIAAVGFCFGGLCALDLARSGADLAGVASIHGLLHPPGLPQGEIRASIIAFHGWDDPMAPPDALVALGRELTEAGADWQIHAFGGAMHAFTNPAANDPGAGLVHEPRAAARTFAGLETFLKEVLG